MRTKLMTKDEEESQLWELQNVFMKELRRWRIIPPGYPRGLYTALNDVRELSEEINETTSYQVERVETEDLAKVYIRMQAMRKVLEAVRALH
jgi:uncharacterized lipoprotein